MWSGWYYNVWTLILAVLNFRGLRIFCVFRFFISRMRVPQYYIKCIDYISVLKCASHISHITKHVWAAQRVRVAIAKQWRCSALLCSAYLSLLVHRSYSAHSNFLCKVCASVNHRSELWRRAKVVSSKIAQRMFEVESCICGIHVYEAVWKPRIGEILSSHFVEVWRHCSPKWTSFAAQ